MVCHSLPSSADTPPISRLAKIHSALPTRYLKNALKAKLAVIGKTLFICR